MAKKQQKAESEHWYKDCVNDQYWRLNHMYYILDKDGRDAIPYELGADAAVPQYVAPQSDSESAPAGHEHLHRHADAG